MNWIGRDIEIYKQEIFTHDNSLIFIGTDYHDTIVKYIKIDSYNFNFLFACYKCL